MTANKKKELARFNMPFELGLDFGCKRYKGGVHLNKKCLILDTEPYRYQKSLSDISGSDISYHNDSSEKVTGHIRNWLQKQRTTPPEPILLTGSKIWTLYNEFEGKFGIIN